MANMLVETLAGDFDASEFEDDYAGAVEALVKAKIEGGEVKKTPTSTKSSGEVVDLLAALQRSVDAAKTARGEDDESPRTRRREAGEEDRRQEDREEGSQEAGSKEEGELTTRAAILSKPPPPVEEVAQQPSRNPHHRRLRRLRSNRLETR